MSFRLIDDLLSVDNPYLRESIGKTAENGGMYPCALRLNETSVSAEEVNFLGMNIRSSGNSFRVDVFDKRAEFPFRAAEHSVRGVYRAAPSVLSNLQCND